MGVDCQIWLPGNVRVRDVANVIGILAGTRAKREDFSSNLEGWSAHVEGVEVQGIPSLPSCAWISFAINDKEKRGTVLYHFEPGEGLRLMLPPSTPFWLAVGSRLIHFFGGKLGYRDDDREENDEIVETPVPYDIAPTDGEPWYEFQQRLLKMEPLTDDEINEYAQYAAYK